MATQVATQATTTTLAPKTLARKNPAPVQRKIKAPDLTDLELEWVLLYRIAVVIAKASPTAAHDLTQIQEKWVTDHGPAAVDWLAEFVMLHELEFAQANGIPNGFEQALAFTKDPKRSEVERADWAHKIAQAVRNEKVRKADQQRAETKFVDEFTNIVAKLLSLPIQLKSEVQPLLRELASIWYTYHLDHEFQQARSRLTKGNFGEAIKGLEGKKRGNGSGVKILNEYLDRADQIAIIARQISGRSPSLAPRSKRGSKTRWYERPDDDVTGPDPMPEEFDRWCAGFYRN